MPPLKTKHVRIGVVLVAIGVGMLSIPATDPSVPAARVGARAFAWNADSLWRELETRFSNARRAGCGTAESDEGRAVASIATTADGLRSRIVEPTDPVLDSLEARFFRLGTLVAACPAHFSDYVALSGTLRTAIKRQSEVWDVVDVRTRERLYRSLYGTRAAVEEVLLHHPDSAVALLPGTDEPSATPGAVLHGVTVHSGDILVSRGGYPTSALIARGNDYPGNFSHVGLVHVDSVTHAVAVIEAHIEVGVAVTTAEGYLADKKLRIMLLRPRADLPQLIAEPLLPHRAAALALDRARAGYIPYDFAMDYTDPSRLFCSEVASSVYSDLGVTLWMGLSTISRPGLRRWLSELGVRHFTTQEPSDLEYDPQLVVVAEWRDPATLLDDHIDNAVLDAMLEGADAGDDLTYDWYKLPAARLAKAYSWLRVQFGGHGPIPEGMSATSALRHDAFVKRQRAIADRVRAEVERQTREQGYPPPYWALVALARDAAH
jgi:Permuted papain-like amidase enzyme, YaeF/YiiX, C92 family